MTAGVVGTGVRVGDGAAIVGGRGVTIWLIGGVEVDRATVADAVEDNEGRIVRDERVVADGRSVATGLAVVAGLPPREYRSAAPTTARLHFASLLLDTMVFCAVQLHPTERS